jgi:hypothetical protein
LSKTEDRYLSEVYRKLGEIHFSIILSLALLPEYYGGKRTDKGTLKFPASSSSGYKFLASVPGENSKSLSQQLVESGLHLPISNSFFMVCHYTTSRNIKYSPFKIPVKVMIFPKPDFEKHAQA